jgi:4-aminobutyrate aminotransferase/(S)-3-amino-2-methylpropionate transaminase
MQNVPRGVATAYPIFVEKAKNAELWDVEGKRYLDFGGGIGVQNFGHSHPKVVEAIKAQSDKVIHCAFQITAYEPYIALAERLNKLAPIEGKTKTIFFSTGAEAVENSVKIARSYTKRAGVISFVGGFHGRSLLAMALTGKNIPYKKGFGPLPGGVFHIPFPMDYHGISSAESLHALQNIFKASIDPTEVAAIIIEPVQGEGGFYIAPFEFLAELRAICDKHGILLIADEVQAGYGRTGKLFAIENSKVKPDLITTAKSIAGGLPLSAVIGRAEVMDAPEPGGLGGTYGGNPVACAAALAILDVIEQENLLEQSIRIGDKAKSRILALASSGDFPFIGEVRGLGAMVAFELVQSQQTHEPAPELAKKLAGIALGKGLLLLSCGIYANVIRILVPITIPDRHLEEAFDILEASLRELSPV